MEKESMNITADRVDNHNSLEKAFYIISIFVGVVNIIPPISKTVFEYGYAMAAEQYYEISKFYFLEKNISVGITEEISTKVIALLGIIILLMAPIIYKYVSKEDREENFSIRIILSAAVGLPMAIVVSSVFFNEEVTIVKWGAFAIITTIIFAVMWVHELFNLFIAIKKGKKHAIGAMFTALSPLAILVIIICNRETGESIGNKLLLIILLSWIYSSYIYYDVYKNGMEKLKEINSVAIKYWVLCILAVLICTDSVLTDTPLKPGNIKGYEIVDSKYVEEQGEKLITGLVVVGYKDGKAVLMPYTIDANKPEVLWISKGRYVVRDISNEDIEYKKFDKVYTRYLE